MGIKIDDDDGDNDDKIIMVFGLYKGRIVCTVYLFIYVMYIYIYIYIYTCICGAERLQIEV